MVQQVPQALSIGAHSGNNYFYFESSSGGLDTASIISPVIDLTSAIGNQAELSFYYHFYGSSGANLNVSISTDLINFSNNIHRLQRMIHLFQ